MKTISFVRLDNTSPVFKTSVNTQHQNYGHVTINKNKILSNISILIVFFDMYKSHMLNHSDLYLYVGILIVVLITVFVYIVDVFKKERKKERKNTTSLYVNLSGRII